ncbi:M56 family metallopeptidase [Lapidilactobacillus luobeiensis]|uniref:M56 family metallopeptidase n=1 Tax=Lapidilactobacillus luobeiensis TaxID=2950371 RepID=UPI0021C4C651|nr:M56 family metallopeptidase [Lapidilactobacillus luobeiensis]
MRFSATSLLITLIFTTLLVVILQLILTHRKVYRTLRLDFLLAFVTIILLRLFLPVEFAFTHTIASHWLLPNLYKFNETVLFSFQQTIVTVRFLLITVWTVGALIMLAWNIRMMLKVHSFSKKLSKKIATATLKEQPITVYRRIPVYQIDHLGSPFVIGIRHPKIIISRQTLAAEELKYILQHEYLHIVNHDILKKYLAALLTCLYWWFIPIYFLKQQVSLIIEMNTDQQTIAQCQNSNCFDYTTALVTVSRKLHQKQQMIREDQHLLPHFTIYEQNTLAQRINFLLEGHRVKHTPRWVLLGLVILPIMMTSIIIEPSFQDEDTIRGTYELKQQEGTYLLQEGDQYFLYIDHQRLGKVSQPDHPSLAGIEVRKAEEE